MPSPFTAHFPVKEIYIEKTCVFFEGSLKNALSYFSKAEAKKFAELLNEAQLEPQKTYQTVLEWKKKHPKNPIVDNLLAFSLSRNEELKKVEQLVTESYHAYPDYLFAKINYADQCLRKKKLDQIPLIFPSFDLKVLFPKKAKFHVSEYRGFMILASRYHLKIGQRQLAQKYYQNAYLADPSHPSLILLEKELRFKNLAHKSLLLFLKLLKLLPSLTKKILRDPRSLSHHS
jgi:tetratricopeptide (TPR) repeat protein